MKRVFIYTGDEYLFTKIALETDGCFECEKGRGTRAEGDFAIWDLDSLGNAPETGEFITVGRQSGADIVRPFPIGAVKELLISDKERAPIELCADKGFIRLNGERIALTDIEYSLFCSLYRRKGDFASRSELNEEVWGREGDGSLLNVYVHYLREKLEKHGEKVIISSRKSGYKIDGRYFNGKGDL